jgi:hypothetical protein
LLSLAKLRRIDSLKRVVERADDVAKSPISRALTNGDRTHEIEPTQP